MKLLQNARLRSKGRCKKFSVLLMETVGNGLTLSAYRVPCKSWNCPKCAKAKTAEISERAQHCFQGERVRFLTLTLKPRLTITEALVDINAGWNRLRLKITRKYGKIKYLKVLEAQRRTKMPHFHILVNRYIDRNWLIKAAQECGFGWHCDIRACRHEQVYNYVLKYLRKGISADDFLEALLETKGRRFGFSRGMIYYKTKANYNIIAWIKTNDRTSTSTLSFLYSFERTSIGKCYPLESQDEWERWFQPDPRQLLLAPPVEPALG